ncbi:PREDICTED: THAP domain-containing protein 1-like isoform X2 [Vollenhovia emeryi]|uniref:THAP domain-containing protein 1-like isoform X2 n=1 Tax=Vollenhovia emeryi TaxID=411798 RepID=UPI0005F396B8|nr:PREDICTED: THAP domain-containing protein 1-like isoform X2 [Vollenhovia emeryi]
MGRECCIKNCLKTRDKDMNLSLYKFPRTNTLKYKWLEAIPPNLITLPVQRNACICSVHFSKNLFRPLTPTGKNLLKQDAIPSIFDTESENERDENSIVESSSEIEQTSSTEKMDKTTKNRASVDMNTVDMNTVDMNTVDMIQVSPTKYRIAEKQIQLQRKIHILQKRLHRRGLAITTMHNLIDTLKRNNLHNSDLAQVLSNNFNGSKFECILNEYRNQNVAKTGRRIHHK